MGDRPIHTEILFFNTKQYCLNISDGLNFVACEQTLTSNTRTQVVLFEKQKKGLIVATMVAYKLYYIPFRFFLLC